MATSTTKVGLRKPALADLVNVTTDISNNMDLIDARIGSKVMVRYTGGNFTIIATAWANLPVAVPDLAAIKCNVGDYVEIGASGLWNNDAQVGQLDMVSVVAGVPVNAWGQNGPENNTWAGIMSWYGIASAIRPVSGGMIKQVVAGDLDASSNLTLRLRGFVSAAAGKSMFATVGVPFVYWAINHGNP